MNDPLLGGPEGLRDSRERRALVASIVALPFSLALVGFVLSTVFSMSHLLLIAIGALLYVSIARGRLLGDSIHVHTGQFPELADLVRGCARLLDVEPPQIFIRDDVLVPIVAVGIGEPYALVISNHWLEHLDEAELRFLVGRELAHIRAGHTRISSILSVNGRENVAVSLVFGAYLRRTEYTADRIGLLCCGSVETATRAIALASFHSVARKIDVAVVAAQLAEIDSEPSLRAGEWLSSSPYATRRIAALDGFAATPLAQRWSERFARARERAVPGSEQPRHQLDPETRRGFAGPWRRAGAWVVDAVVVQAIVPALVGGGSLPPYVNAHVVTVRLSELAAAFGGGFLVLLWFYSVLLVAVAGRTIGMIVADVRILRADFERPTVLDVLRRYTLAALSLLTVFPLILWGLRRVQPYERFSGTRLVSASAILQPNPAIAR